MIINLENVTNETLAAHVVVYRLIGVNKDLSIKCMEELVKRKNGGSDFDYEKYIKEELDKSPKQDKEQNQLLQNILKIDINQIINDE